MWMKAEQMIKNRAVASGLLLAVFVAVSLLAAAPAHAAATIFEVNSTGDAPDATLNGVCETVTGNGICTLRAAIQEANANAGADTINFNIPGAGVQTITPATNLPAITTEAVTINGYSQPGTSANTLAQGNDAVLLIELDETSMGGSLTINADGTTVRGLIINGGNTDKILVAASNVTIAGNFIGVDPTLSLIHI